jgi:hypothetical protein
MLSGFIKTYSSHDYKYTTTTRHKGKVIAFGLATEKGKARPIIVYSVLDLTPSNGSGSSNPNAATDSFDVNYWHSSPQELIFPNEIAAIGYGVADQTTMPVHKKGKTTPETPGAKVPENERDLFLSTTARLTATAPFQALSDGKYVYLFRQAIGAGDPNPVYKLDRDNRVKDKDGRDVPLVDATLLVDRFVLVGSQLQNKLEVRFQRSRSKSRPQSRKDSLGDKDLDGNPFIEPTLELRFVSRLTEGRFAVLLVPTLSAEIQRWQIFAQNGKTGLIDCYGIERASDGLFNLRGTQFYTSPDPKHQKDVFEAKPGTDPFTGEDLIPVVSEEGRSEAALAFDGIDDHVDLGTGVKLGSAFTLEAWIFPERPSGTEPQALITSRGRPAAAIQADGQAGLSVWIEGQTRLRIGFGDGAAWNECTTTSLLSPQAWNHIAVAFDGRALRVFINGRLRYKTEAIDVYVNGERRMRVNADGSSEPAPEPLAGKTPADAAVRYIGAAEDSFSGTIDEIRLWSRPRSERELRADMNQRLHGRELGLEAYWRFDEGSGSTVYDQTDRGTNGTLHGGTWVTSDAPVGEGTGLSRSSFRITTRSTTPAEADEDRTFASGPTALLYYQQANVSSGYDSRTQKPLKQNARVMLAVATRRAGGSKDEIAAIDLGVSAEGKLALLPDVVHLPVIETPDPSSSGRSINERLDELGGLEGRAYALSEDLVNLQRSIDGIGQVVATLDDALARPLEPHPKIPDGEHHYLNERMNEWVAANREVTKAETEVNNLADRLDKARVTIYEHKDYGGRLLEYGKGDVSFDILQTQSFNDIISSLRVPEALQVTAYEHANHGGKSRTFGADTPWVGADWDNIISSFVVEENSSFASKRGEAAKRIGEARQLAADQRAKLEAARGSLQVRLDALAGEKAAKEVERTTIRTQLSGLESELRSGVNVPMGLVHIDAQGLTISGGVLSFAWTKDTPRLFDSATGSLALYFRGTDDQFFVTYYSTLTGWASYPLADGTGEERVVCTARATDLEMDKLTIAVADGDDADHCSVSIAGAEIEESWSAVPRNPEGFVRVLSGAASQREFIGSGTIVIAQGQVRALSVPAGIRRNLPAGTTLVVGRTRVTVAAAAGKGDSTLPITTDAVDLAAEKLPVFYLEYDYDRNARTTKVPGDLYNGSLLVQPRQVADGATGGRAAERAPIGNQRVASGATFSPRWTAESPGSTLAFDGARSYAHLADRSRLGGFDAAHDLTIEAWLKPGTITDVARVIRHRSDASNYTLGFEHDRSPLEFDGIDDHIDFGNILDPGDSPGGLTWTIELWFRCDETDGEHILYDKENRYKAGVRDGFFQYAWQPKWEWCGEQKFAVVPGQWYHAAVVYDGKQQTLYRSGEPVYSRTQSGPIGTNAAKLLLAARGDTAPRDHFKGAIDEVRIWQRDRTLDQIKDNMRRRLKGDETDLVGYWRFQDVGSGVAPDLTSNRHNGTLRGDPRPTILYTVFAGINGRVVRSRESFAVGRWTHLAATFDQSYGLEFDGQTAYLDCGADASLDINGDVTIEVILKVDEGGQTRGLLSKGMTGGKIPYAVSIDPMRHVLFGFEDADGTAHVFRSERPVDICEPRRLAVTRKRESVAFSLAAGEFYSVTWHDIRFYIDGAVAGSARYAVRDDLIDDAAELARYKDAAVIPEAVKKRFKGKAGGQTTFTPPEIGRNNAALEIGRQRQSQNTAIGFKGIVGEVRLWNTALEPDQLSRVPGKEATGLVSRWRFEERTGETAADSVGRNNGKFSGAVKWVKDPNPGGSSLVLYRDGLRLDVDDISTMAKELLDGVEQFTLGATRTANGFTEHFQGEIEELRIWRSVRFQEQIQDNLFRRLTGEQEHLIAYYTFDATHSEELADQGLRGNHLTLKDTPYILSTAPIGPDTPQVRSALAGVKTAFHGKIQSQPGIEEYGDLQYDSAGNLIGTFKRCYSVIEAGQWHLITGFKVGDLSTEWIGQVQFAPQVVGYIEGAPPVPSENLTATGYVYGEFADYTGATSVEFTQAESATYTYSASQDQGADLAVESKLGAVAGVEIATDAVFFSTKTIDVENVIGLHGNFETSWSWLNEATTGVGRSLTKATRMELRGIVENADAVTYPAVGRRFVPDNIGMALVTSETADVFALRLKHNNALVSFQMRPNPNIPPDRNILTFPINPRYIKQGALDGKIGFEPDPDYPDALSYSADISYFKPTEAYALKNQIDREAAELRTQYESYDAGEYGRATPPPTPGEARIEERLRSPSAGLQKHNMVNSYVWTAAGGLFEESQEAIDTHQEVIGGSYAFKGMAGVYTDLTFETVGAGVKFELDAMAGGHLNRTVTRTKESQTAFGLNVDISKVESDVYLRNERGELIMDLSIPGNPQPQRQPGRVDAYRFMTYYVEPKSDHFEAFFNKVVDPLWLEQSDEPNAVALREARQETKKPPCWRILHRVTYVSRVLPPLSDAAPPSLEKTLQTLDIDSNYELIRQLEPFVRDKLASPAGFAKAIEDTIRVYLPELQPHLFEIKQYMALYFGVADGMDGDAFGQGWLAERVPNQPPIVNAGEDQTVGLDGTEVKIDLEGTVIDDRLEQVEAIFVTWTVEPPQAGVLIADPHAPKTEATFTRRGRYVLRLTADDGALSASDEVVVVVNVPPQISAGESQAVAALQAALEGQVLDDGLGDPVLGRLQSTKWSVVSGPGRVDFEQAESLRTTATFDKPGHYLLRLEVDNGSFTVNKELKVAVAARITDQLQALYTFNRFEEDDPVIVRDVSGVGAPLHLKIAAPAATAWVDGGLEISNPTILATKGPATRLTQAAKASGEITIEAWVTPAQATHDGLARIVTLSSGPAARNFTLGQSKGGYYVGLRTTSTNDNASAKAMGAGKVDTTGNRPTHLVCTRERSGRTRLYLNGEEVGTREIDGDLSKWDESFALALGNEFPPTQDHHRAWCGTFSLVAIYSRALTTAEVRQNFEFDADAHLPPVISTGGDQVIDWSEPLPARVELVASATYDRPAKSPSITWSQAGGPTGVKFAPEHALTTTASFPQKGAYVVRLAVDDGALMTSDEARVLVNVPPAVRVAPVPVPPVALIGGRVSRSLTAQVSDTGLALDHDPDATATTMAFRWRQVSGPKMVLDSSDRAEATATFTERGIYALELKADNGHCATTELVAIAVDQRPEVDPGPPQTVTLSDGGAVEVRLQGKVSTGLGDPRGRLEIQWDAPGLASDVVTFNAPKEPVTAARFAAGGAYSLRLTATNLDTRDPQGGPLSASAEVTVVVNRPPVVDAGPDLDITLPAAAVLDGTVGDDGLPKAAVTVGWTQVSGPGQVVFADAKSEYTMARFTKPGPYVLRLTANDGAAEVSDEATITVKPSARVTDDLQVLYTFQEGQGSMVVRDVSGATEAIDLIIEAKDNDKIVWGPGGPVLTVKGVSAIASRSPAAKLINAIRGSKATKGTHAITIEAWIKPAQTKYPPERLPARIVTLSADSDKRNFTLGQVDGTYKVRLRTSGNDDLNGERNALQAGTVDTTKVGHLVYTWEAASGTAVLYQYGKKVGEKPVSGDLSNWSDYRLALGNECTGERAWLGEYHLVAVYARALSSDEVQRNFVAGPNP